jgi:hypothetical protein
LHKRILYLCMPIACVIKSMPEIRGLEQITSKHLK